MVLKILVILVLVCAAFIVAHIIDRIRVRERNKMSFKEALDLTEMTIVTFYNNGKKLNFLLDTGSNDAYISKSASEIEGLTFTPIEKGTIIVGSNGVNSCNSAIIIPLTYKDHSYKVELYILKELDDSFRAIKEADGVQLHGILGTNFLQEHDFVLDFEELVAYKK